LIFELGIGEREIGIYEEVIETSIEGVRFILEMA